MSKRITTRWYIGAWIVWLIALVAMFAMSRGAQASSSAPPDAVVAYVVLAIAGIVTLVMWIGALIRLGQQRAWGWFAAVLVLHYGFGRYPLDAGFLHHPARSVAGNATMAQDFLGVPLALGQSWSLAYELAFYGIVSALFVAGAHTRSARG